MERERKRSAKFSGVARNCTGGFPTGRVGAGGGVAPPSPARGYGGAL